MMDRNNHPNSSSSGCTKIREALANSSAVRTIRRISYYHNQEPSGSPPPRPRHIRGNYKGEGNEVIPIKFVDHPNPTFNGQAQVGKVANRVEPERPHYVPVRGEERGKSTAAPEFEHQNEKKDMNYVFGEFILRVREKLRTVSNIGRALIVAKKKDTHKDQISEFINRTKKKIRIRFGKNEPKRKGWDKYAYVGLTVFGACLIAKHAIQYILERRRRCELQKRALAAAAKRSGQDHEGEKADISPDGAKRDRIMPDLCVICLEHEYNAVFVP